MRAHSITARIVAASALSLGALAAAIRVAAWRTEQRYPPLGSFITVDGVRLHYMDKGAGDAVVLVHGAGMAMQDLTLSVLHGLTRRHRVVIFDRPGCGYSARPRDRAWTPEAQAALLHRAIAELGIDRPLLVGHSFGAAVALSYAIAYPYDVRGAVLISGYYFPALWSSLAALAIPHAPLFGPILRNTLSPLIGWLVAPRVLHRVFAPNAVPPNFLKFPVDLALRPGQLRALGEDLAALRPWARRMQSRYRSVQTSVAILAGAVDQVTDPNRQSTRLHQEIPGATLRVLPGIGHMLHHLAPEEVLTAVAAFDETEARAAMPSARATP